MTLETILHLRPEAFPEAERTLVEVAGLRATAFRFSTGVPGLRLTNRVGQLTLLPFQGQQIWDARFHGRTLTMKSMFTEPRSTQEFLETYGAFLIHCGATAMGAPGPDDQHPPHGELPNATYQSARLMAGQDSRGVYLGLTGSYQYTVAFSYNYLAQPLVRLYENSSRIPVSIRIENLKRSEMELMYLAHVNFRPVDHGRLVYTAPCDPAHVRVRASIPLHIRPGAGYREFLQELARHPERHNVLEPGLAFDPEVVFTVDYQADDQGWAHSMQVHPDGSADYIAHRPAQLDIGLRWISRTPDQDALGIVLPATAEPEGYTAEKAKGNLKILPAGGFFECEMEIGYLTPDEARAMEQKIQYILARPVG